MEVKRIQEWGQEKIGLNIVLSLFVECFPDRVCVCVWSVLSQAATCVHMLNMLYLVPDVSVTIASL